jgi:hypothetical protein
MRRNQLHDQYEMLLRKFGHAPARGYVEQGQWQDVVRCTRCGYQRRATAQEDDIAPCLVEPIVASRRVA